MLVLEAGAAASRHTHTKPAALDAADALLLEETGPLVNTKAAGMSSCRCSWIRKRLRGRVMNKFTVIALLIFLISDI